MQVPYDDILDVRDRMWEVAPHLVRYDVTERVSSSVALLGLDAALSSSSASAAEGVVKEIGKAVFKNPIENFYQTDVVSRA